MEFDSSAESGKACSMVKSSTLSTLPTCCSRRSRTNRQRPFNLEPLYRSHLFDHPSALKHDSNDALDGSFSEKEAFHSSSVSFEPLVPESTNALLSNRQGWQTLIRQ